jgi:cell division protease FtsH
MVTKFGMSAKIGMINYADDDNQVFIGRDLAQAKVVSDDMAFEIDCEVKRIINECYEKGREIIKKRRDILDKCVELLLEKERISREEFEALYDAI